MKRARSRTTGRVSELTLLTPVTPGLVPGERRTWEQRLAQQLDSVQRRVERRIPTPISALPTIHFARWLILRPPQYLRYSNAARAADGGEKPQEPADSCRSWLFFTSNFDGDVKDYLREFSVFLGEDVDRIWGNCEGWPEGGARNFEEFWDYARRHQLPTHAFYAAYPTLSVTRIRQLDRFKQAFDALVAGSGTAPGLGELLGPALKDGHALEEVIRLLKEFLLTNTVYASDFPRAGGTYAGDQQ